MPQTGQKNTFNAGRGTAVFPSSLVPAPSNNPVTSAGTGGRKEKPVYCARCGRPVELVNEEITRFSVTRGFPIKKIKIYKCPKRNKLRSLLNRILITQRMHSKFEIEYGLMSDGSYNRPAWNSGKWVIVDSTHYVDGE